MEWGKPGNREPGMVREQTIGALRARMGNMAAPVAGGWRGRRGGEEGADAGRMGSVWQTGMGGNEVPTRERWFGERKA
jgi:hypothetical protein